MMPRRERARLWLRGFAKLAAVILVAGGVGAVVGIALAELTGDDDDVPPATTRAPTTSGQAVTSPATISASRSASQDPLEQIRFTVGSAVLHPAATAAGQRRRRARLGVEIEVDNRGPERVVLPRPSLLAANQRIPAEPAADGPQTHFGAIEPRTTAKATVQFETAGAVTEQLTTQRRARILVAGRSSPITVVIGSPASSGSRSGAAAPRG